MLYNYKKQRSPLKGRNAANNHSGPGDDDEDDDEDDEGDEGKGYPQPKTM